MQDSGQKLLTKAKSRCYGTGHNATKGIAAATAQANNMVKKAVFGDDFWTSTSLNFLQGGFSQAMDLGEFYLV